ncbi:MAG TPA: hypothetical protein VFU57_08305 [Candidatus Acidoferrales bacterium]|nr:hypothetical protein [Candidatus Acidoferrales bacterium]
MKNTKKTRSEIYLLAVLLVALAFVAHHAMHSQTGGITGGVFASNAKFTPLDVPDPSLRLDLLQKIRHARYNGQDRNIFSAAPLAPRAAPKHVSMPQPQAPVAPPPPPPVTVPATFYGIVTDVATGRKEACFSTGSDAAPLIVPEGGTLLNQFRVLKIGANSVEVQEISSGRTTMMVLMSPPAGAANPQQAQNQDQ